METLTELKKYKINGERMVLVVDNNGMCWFLLGTSKNQCELSFATGLELLRKTGQSI
jgi:hypothetical protein